MKRVFLGGTWNESKWRNVMKSYLSAVGLDYFDPIVDDWNEEAQQEEERQKSICDWSLYVITPKMSGVYSIAEVVKDACNKPENTVLVILEMDGVDRWEFGQRKSLCAVAKLVQECGAAYFNSLSGAVNYMKDNS